MKKSAADIHPLVTPRTRYDVIRVLFFVFLFFLSPLLPHLVLLFLLWTLSLPTACAACARSRGDEQSWTGLDEPMEDGGRRRNRLVPGGRFCPVALNRPTATESARRPHHRLARSIALCRGARDHFPVPLTARETRPRRGGAERRKCCFQISGASWTTNVVARGVERPSAREQRCQRTSRAPPGTASHDPVTWRSRHRWRLSPGPTARRGLFRHHGAATATLTYHGRSGRRQHLRHDLATR